LSVGALLVTARLARAGPLREVAALDDAALAAQIRVAFAARGIAPERLDLRPAVGHRPA
jgi:hypothetical protein